MCLIVVSDRGFSDLPLSWIETAYAANPDGLGAMWTTGGRCRVRHEMPGSAAELAAVLATLPRDRTVALHLRRATAGAVDRDNLHPFPVALADGRTVWLMHNGTLPEHAGCARVSDTHRFVMHELQPSLASQSDWTAHLPSLRARMRASGSRMVLMDDAGRVARVESAASGVAGDGRWYSKVVDAPRVVMTSGTPLSA